MWWGTCWNISEHSHSVNVSLLKETEMTGIPSASELWGELTCFLGLWWRGGVHLCVSAEAVQVPFDGLQRIIPTLLSRLRAHTRPASAQDAVGSAPWKTEECHAEWVEPHLGLDAAEQPQPLFLLLKLPSLPVFLQHFLLVLQVFSGGAGRVKSWDGVQRWRSVINRLTVWITESMLPQST